ncbi:30S ribosomal protein S18 [Candidatus Azambacteria bacterium]|nr:30S ribosomal protein S18 [Candidatus Azambacteria bacterium]
MKMQDQMNQEKKQCRFCSTNTQWVDYKDPVFLRGFVSMQAKMYPRQKTGTCATHQRMLAECIKRARFMAFLPYTIDRNQHLSVQQ